MFWKTAPRDCDVLRIDIYPDDSFSGPVDQRFQPIPPCSANERQRPGFVLCHSPYQLCGQHARLSDLRQTHVSLIIT